MSLEQEVSDYLRDAANTSPMLLEGAVHGEDHRVDTKAVLISLLELVNAERNMLVRLAREIDELRATIEGNG